MTVDETNKSKLEFIREAKFRVQSLDDSGSNF